MFRGLKAFNKDLRDFSENVPHGGHVLIKREAANWFSEVVILTPKDTNFASSMWKTSINKRPIRGSIKHPGGNNYIPAATPSFYNLQADDTLYVYNNVVYIKQLENGYSKQAPANFFNNSARRANRRLQKGFDRLDGRSKNKNSK